MQGVTPFDLIGIAVAAGVWLALGLVLLGIVGGVLYVVFSVVPDAWRGPGE